MKKKEKEIWFELFRSGDEILQEAECSYKRESQPPSLSNTYQDWSKIRVLVAYVTDENR